MSLLGYRNVAVSEEPQALAPRRYLVPGCVLLPHVYTSPSGFRDNAGFKETSFFGDEGRHRKPVLPGEVSEIGDGMPQHLGAFTRPVSVSMEFATENLKMVQELSCSGLLAVIFVSWA